MHIQKCNWNQLQRTIFFAKNENQYVLVKFFAHNFMMKNLFYVKYFFYPR